VTGAPPEVVVLVVLAGAGPPAPTYETVVSTQFGAVTDELAQTYIENGLQLAIAETVGHAVMNVVQTLLHRGRPRPPSLQAWQLYEQLKSCTALVHAAPSVVYAAVHAVVGDGVAPAAVVATVLAALQLVND